METTPILKIHDCNFNSIKDSMTSVESQYITLKYIKLVHKNKHTTCTQNQ